jgi:hypothetical protein
MSSLAESLSSAAELLEDRIDAAVADGVCWGTRSTLVAALSYLLELGTELELLQSGCNTDLTEDQVDDLWAQACSASDLLASYIPLSATAALLMAQGSSGGSLCHLYFSFALM